jgi:hypothetical protein
MKVAANGLDKKMPQIPIIVNYHSQVSINYFPYYYIYIYTYTYQFEFKIY